MQRIKSLDGLRGMAILLVLGFHFCGDSHYFFAPIFRIGWMGVDLFFVLSGYLITTILLNTRGQRNYYRNFYVRRFLRIFPLYYGFLAVFLLIDPIPNRYIP